MSFLETTLKVKNPFQLIGVDEVGRGPLAGPVVACGVSFVGIKSDLSKSLKILSEYSVTDSKKLSKAKRLKILSLLKINTEKLPLNKKVQFTVGNSQFELALVELDNKKVDEINILQASLLAMSDCVNQLVEVKESLVWVDGNKSPNQIKGNHKVETIIKGDSKSALIALASIIAKEYRDQLMKNFGKTFPNYGFEGHSGYPTKKHKEAIQKWGITPIHRKTFKGVKEFL